MEQTVEDLCRFCVRSSRKRTFKYISKTSYHYVNRDRDKRFIKHRRPISLLNLDLKVISRALSEKLKKVLPDLISSQQTAYVKNRHIGESGRLISDVIEIAKIKKLNVFLVAMDIEKAFDSLDYALLILTLEKYDFGKKFYLMGKDFTKRSGVLFY